MTFELLFFSPVSALLAVARREVGTSRVVISSGHAIIHALYLYGFLAC